MSKLYGKMHGFYVQDGGTFELNKLNQLDVTLWKFFIAQHVSNAITFILRSWWLSVGVLLCFGVYWCTGTVGWSRTAPVHQYTPK